MIHSFDEEIRFPEKKKNAGYILVNSGEPGYADILKESIRLFCGGFGSEVRMFGNGEYAYAILIQDRINKLDRISLYRENGNFTFIEGTFYDPDLLRRFRINPADRTDQAFAEWFYDTFRKSGTDFLKSLNGHYSGFLYRETDGRLYAFNDRFSLNRQYIYDDGRRFALSNNIFALCKNRHLKIEIDTDAIGQILQFDYPVGRRSEFTNIRHILPCDLVSRKEDSLYVQKLDLHSFNREERLSTRICLDRLIERFHYFFDFLDNYLDEPTGLFISRGKDCRLFLHFLENSGNYELFSFATDESAWSFLEAKQVERIAEYLSKDLYRLENFRIDRNIAVIAGMNTTATSSWFALAQPASRFTDYAFIGHGGDMLSGKLECFRNPMIKSMSDLILFEYEYYSNGVRPEDITESIPCLDRIKSSKDQFFSFYKESRDDLLCNSELKHGFQHRWYRHSIPILHKTNHFLTPIYPYLEKNICQEYFNLPVNMIRTQKLHAIMAAREKKSNKVQSTEFPVSLKFEPNARPLMHGIIKLNNRWNDRIFRYVFQKRSKGKGNQPTGEYVFRSSFMKEIAGPKIRLENKRLQHRLKVLDSYLSLVLDMDFKRYCNVPAISMLKTEPIAFRMV